MKCACGEDARCCTVKKEGPNIGRSFWSCHYKPSRCNHFQWATPKEDEEEKKRVRSPSVPHELERASVKKVKLVVNDTIEIFVEPHVFARMFDP